MHKTPMRYSIAGDAGGFSIITEEEISNNR